MSNAEIRGNSVFAEATGLKSVILKGMSTGANGASKKYTYTFDKCTNLESVTVEKDVTMLGDYSFRNCGKLDISGLKLSKLTEMGAYVFQNCTTITNITLPQTLVKLGGNSFNGWTTTQSIYVDMAESDIVVSTSRWYSTWKNGCNANIIYKRAEAAA